MEFGKQLAKYREEHDIDQKDIAKLLNITPQTVSNYETGKNKIPYEKLIALCNYYKIDPIDLIGADLTFDLDEKKQQEQQILSVYNNLPSDSDKKRIVDFILGIGEYDTSNIIKLKDTSEQNTQPPDNIVHLINMGEIIYIDTHPQPVSAGKGNIYIDDIPVSKLYPSTAISSKAGYCVRISGDSMYPNYLDGDIVYVDNRTKDLINGDIGIFVYDGEAYCKRYYKENDIKKLISLNPDQEKYSPIIIKNNTLEVQGKVIGKFHTD